MNLAVEAVSRGIADTDFDGTMNIETVILERDIMIFFRLAVNPCRETRECFGAFVEWQSPLVDPLAIQTVHQ